jgi:hypothetical protein
MVSGFDFDVHGKQVQTESLEGIERVRLDCDDLDLSLEVDPTLSGSVQLVTVSAEKPPILRREGFDLVISQRGRYRPGDRDPAVLRLPHGCPPVSGNHGKGSIWFQNVTAAIMLKKESGDVQVEGGEGTVTVEAGKGDAWFRGRAGAISHHSGSGDVQLERCDGPVAINLGKGDVHARESQRAIVVRSGSGDVQLADCAGDLLVKSGSGDVIVTRPREQRVSISNGSGDVTIEDGSLVGMAVRTSRGDVSCSARLLLNGRDSDDELDFSSFDADVDVDSRSFEQYIARTVQDALSRSGVGAKESIARAVEDALGRANAREMISKLGEFEFEAGDQGVRISRGGRPLFEASDQGVRFARGDFAFEAGDTGVRIKRSTSFGEAGVRDGEYDIETSGGDISIQVPLGLPARVEVLVNSGDVRSDIPLVTVGRPGPRGSTQRLVGGTNPGDGERINLRIRTDRGDVRLRAVRPAPSAPPPPPAPPRPAPPPPPIVPANEREERMQTILNAVAGGSLSIAEAEKLLEALAKGS